MVDGRLLIETTEKINKKPDAYAKKKKKFAAIRDDFI